MISRFVFVLSLITLLLSACNPTPAADIFPSDSTITITDTTGHTITLDDLPERIVIAGSATVMVQDTIYLFPEAIERVVALENRKQSAFTFLPLVDPFLDDKDMLEINAGPEQIVALQPDLVILKNFMAEKLGYSLAELGIPVIYLNLETPEIYYQDIVVLGQVFGNPERALEIVDFYQSRVSAIEDAMSDLEDEDKPDVLVLEYSEKGGDVAFQVPPTSWLQTMLVQTAGGKPIWTDTVNGGGWTIITIEQIAAWDPDQIFIIDYAGSAVQVVERLISQPIWSNLKAVENGQIYAFAFDFYSWDQPDTRWILGLQWLATKIQPQRTTEIDILGEINNFYSQLYRIEPTILENEIIPKLTGDIP